MANIGDEFVVRSLVPGGQDMTVIFRGIQQTGFAEYPPFPTYDVTIAFAGKPAYSTVDRAFIEENGYVFPNDAP